MHELILRPPAGTLSVATLEGSTTRSDVAGPMGARRLCLGLHEDGNVGVDIGGQRRLQSFNQSSRRRKWCSPGPWGCVMESFDCALEIHEIRRTRRRVRSRYVVNETGRGIQEERRFRKASPIGGAGMQWCMGNQCAGRFTLHQRRVLSLSTSLR